MRQKPTAKRQAPATSPKPQNDFLASSAILPGQTAIADDDLYNEPIRKRIDAGLQWIRFFDGDSNFLKELMGLVNYSPTLRRIINDKTDMVVGDGFIPTREKAGVQLTVTRASDSRIPTTITSPLEEYLSNVNLHGQSLSDVLKSAAFEFDAFGNAVIELVRGRAAGEPFFYAYHVPMWMVGVRKPGIDQVVRSLGIYESWEEVPLTSDGSAFYYKGFREMPIYPNWTELDEMGTQRSAIHLKTYAPGFQYYGLPEWIGAKKWAEIEYRIAAFNINSMENGFMPSVFMQLFGNATPDEAEQILSDIERKFTGNGNERKIFMQILRDPTLAANIQTFDARKEGEFVDLQEMAASAIVVANRWSKSLAGFATTGQLGTNEQMRRELEYLQNTVVKQRQNMFLSRFLNPFMRDSAEWTGAPWGGIYLGISNSLPISFYGDFSVENALTQNEKRELLGYAPLDLTETGTDTDIEKTFNAYGVGVRAGAITAQMADEQFFRQLASLPEMGTEVQEVWADEGVRRPITLKSTEERAAELEQTTSDGTNTSE